MSCANTRKVTLTKSGRRSFTFVNFKLRNNRRYVFKFLCWQTYFEGHLVRSNDNWSLFWWEFLIMVSHARVFLLLSFPSPTNKRKMSISNNWITSLRGQFCMLAQWPMRLELIAASTTIKGLGVFLLPLDGMLVHRRVTSTQLYTWVKKGTVRVTQRNLPGQGSNLDRTIRRRTR